MRLKEGLFWAILVAGMLYGGWADFPDHRPVPVGKLNSAAHVPVDC